MMTRFETVRSSENKRSSFQHVFIHLTPTPYKNPDDYHAKLLAPIIHRVRFLVGHTANMFNSSGQRRHYRLPPTTFAVYGYRISVRRKKLYRHKGSGGGGDFYISILNCRKWAGTRFLNTSISIYTWGDLVNLWPRTAHYSQHRISTQLHTVRTGLRKSKMSDERHSGTSNNFS